MNVHLVGSVLLSDRDAVFQACAQSLGPLLPRYTDGETGNQRQNWVHWLRPLLERHPQLELEPERTGPNGEPLRRYFRIALEVEPKDVHFAEIGYATIAKASYARFRQLRDEGVIPSTARFQVSIPTPLSFVNSFITPAERLTLERAYAEAIFAEITDLAATIPAADLAIQWDALLEILIAEGVRPDFGSVTQEAIVERLAEEAGAVPAGVQVGFHLCYGDTNHRHIVEPKDTGLMVELINAARAKAKRKIDFVHMPVPRDRSDDAYFAPLAKLANAADIELCLGLVHYTDGLAGAKRRIAAAAKVAPQFTIATECGFGRRPPETIVPLLELHREAATAG